MVLEAKPRTVYWLDQNLYLNITNKCSNNCIFCFRNFKSGVANFTLKLNCEPSFEQVKTELEAAFRRKVWKEVVFCGFGEPTERLDLLLKLARWIKSQCGKAVIRVNTNGQGIMLNAGRDVVREFKTAGVDKVSVSLNCQDEDTYNEVCKPTFSGAYAAVSEFVKKAIEMLDVEVTAVTTPEIDPSKVESLAQSMGVKFRLRQCVPCFW